MSELHEQIALFGWANFNPILRVHLFHVPNGGYRNAREGAKFKRMGVRAGIPDIFLAYPIAPYAGLWIELKRRKTTKPSKPKPTAAQSAYLDAFQQVGYATCVAYGWEEAKAEIKKYMGEI